MTLLRSFGPFSKRALRSLTPQHPCLGIFHTVQLVRQTGQWHASISTQSLPTVAQIGFWRSLVPKFMRGGRPRTELELNTKKKDWNPATFFIVIFLLIGSQAIQMISLRRGYDRFSHETEAKLSLLREVVKRVQNGEDVDVETMLGTGNKVKEKEWDDVMRELEQEDAIFQLRKRDRKKVNALKDRQAFQPTDQDAEK